MIDLRKSAEEALEKAKGLLVKCDSLVPVAMVYHKDGIDVIGMNFKNRIEKSLAYGFLKSHARRKKALAIISVNEGWLRKYAPEEADAAMKNYRNGDLEFDPKHEECIIVAVKSPGSSPFGLMQPFERKGNTIVFGELKVMDGEWALEFNLVKDW